MVICAVAVAVRRCAQTLTLMDGPSSLCMCACALQLRAAGVAAAVVYATDVLHVHRYLQEYFKDSDVDVPLSKVGCERAAHVALFLKQLSAISKQHDMQRLTTCCLV